MHTHAHTHTYAHTNLQVPTNRNAKKYKSSQKFLRMKAPNGCLVRCLHTINSTVFTGYNFVIYHEHFFNIAYYCLNTLWLTFFVLLIIT